MNRDRHRKRLIENQALPLDEHVRADGFEHGGTSHRTGKSVKLKVNCEFVHHFLRLPFRIEVRREAPVANCVLRRIFEDATIRRFVVSLARRIRKYDGSLVFATQNPGDLLSSDQGAVVATNPATAFFGSQRPVEAAKLQDAFHLSPHQRAFLEAAHRGDFLLAAGSDRLAVEVKAPPWQEEAMRVARTTARSLA